MKPEEVQKLLGGYATGTLTPEEQQALFDAALHDQELFDALAKEQPLRDLLRDPAARAHVLAAMDDRPRPWWQFANRWVLVGAAAACLAAGGFYLTRPKPAAPRILVAELKEAPVAEQPKPKVPPKQEPAPASSIAPRREKAKVPIALPSVPTAAPAAAPPVAVSTGSVAPPAPASTPKVEVTAEASNLVVEGAVVSGALGGALPEKDARALFYATPGVAGQAFLGSQEGASQARIQQQLAVQARAAGSGGAGFFVPNPGVKWTALRRQPDGLFREVDPGQIQAGDTIKLRLVPNDNGFLSVFEGGNPLVSNRRTQPLQPLETPEITGIGKKELTVLLARQAQPLQQAQDAQQKKTAGVIRAAATDQLSQIDSAEHAVYEVKTGNNRLAPVLVKITLNFQ